MKLQWTLFKQFLLEKELLSLNYFQFNEIYVIQVESGPFNIQCYVRKNTTDAQDFEENYKDTATEFFVV